MGHLLQQPYDYYLVMDLECTCELNDRNYPNEIIEFPVILINSRTLSHEAEFHRFVKPVLNTKLSEFCTSLTGITQETIDNAQPFSVVLEEFDQWLQEQNLTSEKICFVTDGIWDMKKFIALEFSRLSDKNEVIQRMKSAFSTWVDIRQLFSAFYGIRATGIENMLSKWNMNFSGRQHAGIDDTRNIATIATLLMGEGCLFYSSNTEDQASQTQEEIAMLNTIREIKKINKTLLCDKKQSQFASHNRYQVYQFRGTLQQVKSMVPMIKFGSEDPINDNNRDPEILLDYTVKVSIQTSKKSDLQMRLCGLEVVNQLEYEENPFQPVELSFDSQDSVVFKKAAFAGSLEQMKKAITTIKRGGGTIIMYFYIDRSLHFEVNFPWTSNTSNDKKDLCWLDISCKHNAKATENQSKLMLTVAKLLKLNPSLAPPSFGTLDQAEEEWREWRGKLIARKKELQQMKMKFKKDNPNNVVMTQKKNKKSPPNSPRHYSAPSSPHHHHHYGSHYNSPNGSPKHYSNPSSKSNTPVNSPRSYHHHQHSPSKIYNNSSPLGTHHHHQRNNFSNYHYPSNRFCADENHQSTSLLISNKLMFSY